MKPIKVAATEKKGKANVCLGKLILVVISDGKKEKGKAYLQRSSPNGGLVAPNYLQPIIVSETERVKPGDKIHPTSLAYDKDPIQTAPKSVRDINREGWYLKIIAMPENFSRRHINDIAAGKLNDGDEVLVKCVGGVRSTTWEHDDPEWWEVELDKDNHIKVLPVKTPQAVKNGRPPYNCPDGDSDCRAYPGCGCKFELSGQ